LNLEPGALARVREDVEATAEGMPESFRSKTVTKFRPGGLVVAHCGGSAGLFSAILSGWASGPKGSQPVVQEIRS
jgi:hypothetical protein